MAGGTEWYAKGGPLWRVKIVSGLSAVEFMWTGYADDPAGAAKTAISLAVIQGAVDFDELTAKCYSFYMTVDQE